MAENAARVDWAGVGVRLAPRFCTPWGVRLAVRRALGTPALRERAAEVAAWAFANPGPAAAAAQLERWAATRRGASRAGGRRRGRDRAGTMRTSSVPVRPGVPSSPGSV